jgi:hypothetical protein
LECWHCTPGIQGVLQHKKPNFDPQFFIHPTIYPNFFNSDMIQCNRQACQIWSSRTYTLVIYLLYGNHQHENSTSTITSPIQEQNCGRLVDGIFNATDKLVGYVVVDHIHWSFIYTLETINMKIWHHPSHRQFKSRIVEGLLTSVLKKWSLSPFEFPFQISFNACENFTGNASFLHPHACCHTIFEYLWETVWIFDIIQFSRPHVTHVK